MTKLIIGHTTNKSVKIWVRGTSRWPVAFVDLFNSAGSRVGNTKKLELKEEEFYTDVLVWAGLNPGQAYNVKVAFGKTKSAASEERIRDAYTGGKFRTFSDAENPKFSFMLGSCNLHSLGLFEKPDEAWIRMSKIAKSSQAKFMVHCGDQIYADIPFSPSSTLEHYRSKYLDAWEDCKPAQKMLTELPHYMVLDDHEITNNYDTDTINDDQLLNVAMKVYHEFQHKHNPDTSDIQGSRRYHYTFNYGGVEFFVMDTRTSRESDDGLIIDPPQMETFKRWLTQKKHNLKFVVTSVPFIGQVKKPKKDKWCDPVFDTQRGAILNHVLDQDVRKLVFLTGDMHTSYYAKMQIEKGSKSAELHELMSSPINQITPSTSLKKKYDPDFHTTISGVDVHSQIESESFYGNHSNVMVIGVDGGRVSYQIHRTTKTETGPTGEFLP